MILMPETPQEPRHKLSALTTLAVVLATFLLAAAAYVCWQAAHIHIRLAVQYRNHHRVGRRGFINNPYNPITINHYIS